MFTEKDQRNLSKYGNAGITGTVEKIHQIGLNTMVFYIKSDELKNAKNTEGTIELTAGITRFSAASYKGKVVDIVYNKKRGEILGIKSVSDDGVLDTPAEV